MTALQDALDRLAEEIAFSGVVRVDRGGRLEVAAAYGEAHRGHAIANTVDTRFAIASGSKTLTALTVVSLIEDGVLTPTTSARSVLGGDLALIDDAVTVEHLLAHRSGIGDYLDEDAPMDLNDYLLSVPVHELATTEQFVVAIDGHPAKFPPDERFSYCNGGYIVLALIAERASGTPFHDLVAARVVAPAGMVDTEFLRSDELPGRTATGYLDVGGTWRSNVFHLPVRGNGDGGLYTTAADVRAFWMALFAGRIVAESWVTEMVRPRSRASPTHQYGLGFWLPGTGGAVQLEGGDSGVSFRSTHDPLTDTTSTVIANTTDGAWPIARLLAESAASGR
ncbi:MAG: beta-lactamase family protein [Actinomycetota bacterium]|nr:beta-lactamase family protein [Actinomycetota bacterium]